MNYKKCSICGGAASAGDKCAEHAAKWQRRFFYPCRYCGGHVKSYKAKRCRLPACISRAMAEAAAVRFPAAKHRKPHREYAHGEFSATLTGWARAIGVAPSLISYHLKRGKTISEIIKRFEPRTLARIKANFTKKKGKKNAR